MLDSAAVLVLFGFVCLFLQTPSLGEQFKAHNPEWGILIFNSTVNPSIPPSHPVHVTQNTHHMRIPHTHYTTHTHTHTPQTHSTYPHHTHTLHTQITQVHAHIYTHTPHAHTTHCTTHSTHTPHAHICTVHWQAREGPQETCFPECVSPGRFSLSQLFRTHTLPYAFAVSGKSP